MKKLLEGWMSETFSRCFKAIAPTNKIKTSNYLAKGNLSVIDQGDGLVAGYVDDKSLKQITVLPVIIFGDHTRRFKFVDFDFVAGADGIKILQINHCLIPKFAYYQCLTLDFPSKGYSRHFQYVKKSNLVYPESKKLQQQIVDEIEKQFTRLDASVKDLKSVKDKLEVYRKSLLKAAFEGKLIIFDQNNEEPLGKITTNRKEKLDPKKNPHSRYIGMADVESGTGKILNEIYAESMVSSSAKFLKNDVLYGRLRPYLNKVVLAEISGLASGEFIILISNNKINPNYLAWRLRCSDFVNFANSLDTGDRPRVNYNQIKEFKIKFPSINQQKVILDEIESRFSVIDKLEQIIDSALLKTEQLRKSILKNAFEGKLITEKEIAST